MLNKSVIAKMVEYLQTIEVQEGFMPWDDENHAYQNLLTVFDCHPEEAREAVRVANVSTRQPESAG